MKKLLLILAILAGVQVSYAAIAFDATSGALGSTVNPQPLNFSFTVAANTYVVCTETTNGGFTSTGVTAGGAAMTQLANGTDGAGPTQYLFGKYISSAGSLSISMGATGSAVAGSCISYTGVDSTTPYEATSTTASVTTTSFTTTLTTITDQAWVVTTARLASGLTPVAGANTTVRILPEVTFFGGGAMWDSGGGRSTGSNSLNVTSVNQLYGVGLMVALKPAGGATVKVPSTLGWFKLFKLR